MPDASLNEVRALCRKAARGAGYGWGMAEEAGRFAWMLSRCGLDGPRALLLLLDHVEGNDPQCHAPNPAKAGWASTTGLLCPLAVGVSLLDRSHQLCSVLPLRFRNVISPILLVATVDLLAAGRGLAVRMEWDGMSYPDVVDRQCNGPDRHDIPPIAGEVRMELAAGRTLGTAGPVARQPVDSDTWDGLERYARRTYAPATALSRIRGAGERDTDLAEPSA